MKITIDKTSNIPLYLQVKYLIEKQIVDGSYAAGAVFPTLTEVAKATSVSVRTVQKAFREMEAEGICYRSSSRKLVLGEPPEERNVAQTRNVIVVCHQMGEACFYTDSLAMQMFAGVQGEVRSWEQDVEIVMAGVPLAESLSFYLANPCMNILGVVLLHWQDRDELESLSRRFPRVRFMHLNYALADLETLPTNVSGVYNDDFAGGYQGTDFLLSHGVTRPAFFELTIPPHNMTYSLRLNGFLSAVKDHGLSALSFKLPPNEKGTSYGEQIRNHREFFARTLTANPDIDGVLTCYDPLAEAIGEHLLQKQFNDKIKLMSYDGHREMNICIFSSVDVDYRAMGQKAARFLADPEGKPRFLRVMPQLVVRNSGLVAPRICLVEKRVAASKSV